MCLPWKSKAEQKFDPNSAASEVVGPNAKVEFLNAVICLGNRGIWDYSSVKGVRKKYIIVDELKPKIAVGTIGVAAKG